MDQAKKDKDPIATALDVTPIEGEVVPVDKEVNPEMENDFKYARENLYNIIESSQESLSYQNSLARACYKIYTKISVTNVSVY